MKRERTKSTAPPEVTLGKKQQKESTDYDRSSSYSVPKALKFLSCVLSSQEIDIINRVVSLSSKYLDKGGCNLSNEQIAHRQQCSKPVVSQAISKAAWLGMLANREDKVEKYSDSDGKTFISQSRRLLMRIPLMWEILGDIWAEFYFAGDEECEKVLVWAQDRLRQAWEDKLDAETFQAQFCEGVIKSSFRGYFENFLAPHGKLFGTPTENFTLFMFSVLSSRNKVLEIKEGCPVDNRCEPDSTTSDEVEPLTKESSSHQGPTSTPVPTPVKSNRKVPHPEVAAGKAILKRLRLGDMLEAVTHTTIPLPPQGSQDYFKLCSTLGSMTTRQGISLERIKAAIRWYWDNHEEQFAPLITSFHSFKDKFPALEAAMKRRPTNGSTRSDNGQSPSKKLGGYGWYRDDIPEHDAKLGLGKTVSSYTNNQHYQH